MRVDGILYFPYHNVGHDSFSVKSDGNGLVLTQLINMAKTAQVTHFIIMHTGKKTKQKKLPF